MLVFVPVSLNKAFKVKSHSYFETGHKHLNLSSQKKKKKKKKKKTPKTVAKPAEDLCGW